MTELVLSTEGRVTAGVLLLSVLAVQSGGLFMLQVVQRKVPIWLVYAGALSLSIGVVTLGIGLLTS
jgi:hypothetical protein